MGPVAADRIERFEQLKNNWPQPGDVLRGKNNEPIKVFADVRMDSKIIRGGKPVLRETMYCNAAIDDEVTGWYLVNEVTGLKCLIMPNSQKRLAFKFDGKVDLYTVQRLRVVRHTEMVTALVCDLME